ncbi:MAG: SIS domain-containing protein [Candidatus Lokiarchaeota archaeon]|nr:SIS domain-containing protein [Candidatus Lokiarchaeota archaeon]
MEKFSLTLKEIATNIIKVSEIIDIDDLEKFIFLIKNSRMTFIYGAGRSGFIGRCFAQRLMHLGFESCFISDAVTKRFTNNDCVILISGSGSTLSTQAIANGAKKIAGKLILITSNPECEIARFSDLVFDLKSKTKISKEKSLAPYTSLFDSATLAFTDAVARLIMDKFNIPEKEIDQRHASLE